MTVDLRVPQEILGAVKRELESNINLLPLPFEKGSVQSTALGTQFGGAPTEERPTSDGPRLRIRIDPSCLLAACREVLALGSVVRSLPFLTLRSSRSTFARSDISVRF